MTAPVPAVTLDVLPLKRVLALEEAGNELLPVEPTPEEKPLALLGRIDFGQTVENVSKKAKAGKEATPATPAVWPWQGLVDNLKQAHQELNIILDLITHVEANDAITVVNMSRPKLLPHEAFNDLALRASSKVRQFRDVGKYLRRTARALERQVEKEAVFYGALMRLQRNWKVKRQRVVSAGPGGNAGFSIDVSFPLPADITFVTSARAAALSSVNLDQDATGLLQAQLPAGRYLNKLNLSLRTTQPGRTVWERQDLKEEDVSTTTEGLKRGCSDVSGTDQESQSLPERGGMVTGAKPGQSAVRQTQGAADRGVGEGVVTGAKAAQFVLRHIQSVIYDEQVFEWVGREAVLPNSGMNVIGIGDTCLQFSLGHAASLTLELSEIEKDTNNTDSMDHEGQFDKGEDEAGGKGGITQSLASTQTSEGMNNPYSSNRFYGRSVVPNDSSLVVCLHQAFHQGIFGFPIELDPGLVTFKMGVGKSVEGAAPKTKETPAAPGVGGKEPGKIEGSSAIKHFSAIMCHRVLSSRVLAELEKQVSEVPHFQLSLHPTWHPRVSAWDLSLATPTCAAQEGLKWASAETQEVRFQCTVVLRDDLLTVEGLDGESRFEAPLNGSHQEISPLNKHSVGLSELPTFLLFQVATELVSWLHDEALTMGLKVSRDLLSVLFQLEGCDHIAIVACPDAKSHCINWWMRTWSSGMEDASQKDDFGTEKGHHHRFLGPLGLGTLRKVVLDLINLENSSEAGIYD